MSASHNYYGIEGRFKATLKSVMVRMFPNIVVRWPQASPVSEEGRFSEPWYCQWFIMDHNNLDKIFLSFISTAVRNL